MRHVFNACFLLLIVGSLFAPVDEARAGGFMAQFTDSLDGHFDIGRWLDSAYGFVPVATVITQPATGYGVAGGLVFIHRSADQRGKPLTTPPDVYGAMGYYTENGSWGSGGFYRGHWRKDRYRYNGFAGYVSMNLTYYPVELSEYGIGYEFNIEGGGLIQRLLYRLKRSRWFVGGEYGYFKNTVKFDSTQDIPHFGGFSQDFHLGHLGAIGTWDTRDFTFTTNNGYYSDLNALFYAPAFGSDQKFQKYQMTLLGWRQYRPVVFGLRLDARLSGGDIPFYTQPFVNMRGVAALRYQDQYTTVIETEERWNITPRWAVDGFFGLGKAFGDENSFGDADLVYSVGGGFRYLLARYYNLYGGLDVGRGPNQWAVYFVLGQWWNGM
jgi:hypothetical protein